MNSKQIVKRLIFSYPHLHRYFIFLRSPVFILSFRKSYLSKKQHFKNLPFHSVSCCCCSTSKDCYANMSALLSCWISWKSSNWFENY